MSIPCFLSENFFIVFNANICGLNVLILISSYSSLRLLDVPSIYSLMPLTVDELKIEVTRASAEVVEILNHHWIEECAHIVRENKESVEAAAEPEDEVK